MRFCGVCGTIKEKSGKRDICRPCSRLSAKKSYHKNKKPLTEDQKRRKKKTNLKWKYTIRESGLTNQQISTLKSRYGITEGEVVELLARQEGACAICKKSLDKEFLVDHCHKTQKVRGLLCRDCNFGIGIFKDSPNLLEKAIQYLKKEYR